jgi:hypothetical protein
MKKSILLVLLILASALTAVQRNVAGEVISAPW